MFIEAKEVYFLIILRTDWSDNFPPEGLTKKCSHAFIWGRKASLYFLKYGEPYCYLFVFFFPLHPFRRLICFFHPGLHHIFLENIVQKFAFRLRREALSQRHPEVFFSSDHQFVHFFVVHRSPIGKSLLCAKVLFWAE